MHLNKFNNCILSTVIGFRRFSKNLFNMWLFKTCLLSLLLSWFTVCLHYVYLMTLFTPYCLSIQNSLLKLFTNLNKSSFFSFNKVTLNMHLQSMQILFMNSPKENIKVSRQNNNDALQTYIFCIKTYRLLSCTFSETYLAKGINPLSRVF